MRLSGGPPSLTKHDTSQSLLDRVAQSKHDNDGDWRQFCGLYQPFLIRRITACGVDAADVDDVVQECLTTVFQSINGFTHNGRSGAFRKWLKTVVSQRVSRYFQRCKRKPAKTNSVAVESYEDKRWINQLETDWDREHDEFVVSNVAKLIRDEFSQTTWAAFEMQVFAQESTQSVAAKVGISINAALIAKSRVMTRLRSICHQMVD